MLCAPAATLSFEDGGSMHWQHHTVTTAVLAHAKITPTAAALRGPISLLDGTYRELSYADLVSNAKVLINKMVSFLGGGDADALKGKAIAILLPRDVDYVGE